MSVSQLGVQRFGRYLLNRSLAKGGMAEIFLAEYEATANVKKRVVLKKILPSFADDERFVGMFIDEAKITVKLSHGNIAQVFDFGEIGGEYFLAMEYIRGHSLSQVRRRAAEKGIIIPPHIVCYVVMEMCKGLHYAHRKAEDGQPLGIVHRDVSPQNVMVSYEGQVKVVDFGIAKARNLASKTRAGALKGKYLYFSPEQARGRELDGRSDVFAAGVVLYELITGVLPFRGPLMDVLCNVVEGRFAPPTSVVPTIKPSLERIILRAMATKKEDRYQTAMELQEALAGFLYSVAPRFTSAGLAHYMSYLYAPELAEQGISTDLPSDFLEQVPLWSLEPEEPKTRELDPATEKTDPEISSEESNTASETAWEKPPTGSTGKVARPVNLVRRRKVMRTLLAAGLILGSVAAIAAAVVSTMRSLAPPPAGAGLVIVNSTPSDALVAIDGVETNRRTPFVLESLVPGRYYTLRFRLDGHREVIESVTPSSEGPTNVSAALEALPVAPPRPRLADVEAAIREERGIDSAPASQQPTAEGGQILGRLDQTLQSLLSEGVTDRDSTRATPITADIQLRRVAIDVRRVPALRITLDPARSHTVFVEGSAHLGSPMHAPPSSEACFVVARANDPGEAGVVSAAAPLSIPRGARTLHLMVPDRDPSDNEGSLTVRVVDQTGKTIERSLDYKAHSFDPRRFGAAVLGEMSPITSYRATVSQDNDATLFFVRAGLPTALTRPGTIFSTMGVLESGLVLRATTELAVFSLGFDRPRGQRTAQISLRPE